MIKIKDAITFKKIIESAYKLGTYIQISIVPNGVNLYGMNESRTLFFKIFFSEVEFEHKLDDFESKLINIYIKDLKNQLEEITINDALFLDIDEIGLNFKIISNNEEIITDSKLICLEDPLNLKEQLENLEKLIKKAEIEFMLNGEMILKKLNSAKYYSDEITLKIINNYIILKNHSSLGNYKSKIKINYNTLNKFKNRYFCDSIINSLVFHKLNNIIKMKVQEEGPIIIETEISNDSFSIIFIAPLVGGEYN